MRDVLDRFYTNPNVAKSLISQIDLTQYELVVEPSAGCGSFSLNIPNCLALDLSPQHYTIHQQDFLNYQYGENIDRSHILCIGNPPFGRQSSLALKFIKKCSEFADTIAFILPLSFKKDSIQRKIPSTYHLIKQIDLPEDSFILNDLPYSVPCVFQVWQNLYTHRPSPEKVLPIGFKYVRSFESQFSVRRVGLYSGKAFLDLNKSQQSHYFIRLDSELSPEDVVCELNKHHWAHQNTVGPRSISKPELNMVLNVIIQKLHY